MAGDISITDGPTREVVTNRETERGVAFGSVSRGRFDTPIEDIWRLFDDPERMRQWNPDLVSGEFRLGGSFSVENNASGEVLRCEPPRMFRVSWIYEGDYSELEVRIGSTEVDETLVEIEHRMREEDLEKVGMTLTEGLVASGAGWDLALAYLGKYLRGELESPPTAGGAWEPTEADLERYGQYELAWEEVATEQLRENDPL